MQLLNRVVATSILALSLSGGYAASADAQTAPTDQQVLEAQTDGDTLAQRDARNVVAAYFYATTDLTSDRYADDAKGIDFSKPVQVIKIAEGKTYYQYVRTGYDTVRFGNFFSPVVSATPDCLGISATGRAAYKAVMPGGQGLRSTAGPIVDNWTTSGVSVETKGGCAQVVVPNTVKAGVTDGGPVK